MHLTMKAGLVITRILVISFILSVVLFLARKVHTFFTWDVIWIYQRIILKQ